jgi:hypothetical protein
MLRREPKTQQRWNFKGGGGTAADLADAVQKIFGLMPDAEFEAKVKTARGDELIADEPQALSGVSVDPGPSSVDVDMTKWDRSGDESHLHYIRLRFGSSPTGNAVSCQTGSEMGSRVIIESAKDALEAGIPAYARWKHHVGGKLFIVLGASYLMAVGVGVFVGVLADNYFAGLLAFAVLGFFSYWPAGYIDDHFLPSFEVYEKQPLRRRFALQLWAVIVGPLIVGLILLALSK